jgi:CRISPR/Cas system CMR-associated protein Cmr3 (group 5 of RAMP superfamily)
MSSIDRETDDRISQTATLLSDLTGMTPEVMRTVRELLLVTHAELQTAGTSHLQRVQLHDINIEQYREIQLHGALEARYDFSYRTTPVTMDMLAMKT